MINFNLKITKTPQIGEKQPKLSPKQVSILFPLKFIHYIKG